MLPKEKLQVFCDVIFLLMISEYEMEFFNRFFKHLSLLYYLPLLLDDIFVDLPQKNLPTLKNVLIFVFIGNNGFKLERFQHLKESLIGP
jgi:hypothetical protein